MKQINWREGLYDPSFEHDNCGIGAIISVNGDKSHALVADALKIVEHLEHRAGKDAEGKTGDGYKRTVPVVTMLRRPRCLPFIRTNQLIINCHIPESEIGEADSYLLL